MKNLTCLLYLLAAAVLAAGLTACEADDQAPPAGPSEVLTGAVKIQGSGSTYSFVQALADSFMRQHPGVRVEIGVSRPDGGFSHLARGEADIVSASRPAEVAEVELAARNDIAFFELPVAYDALAVVTSPGARFLDCLTTDELRTAWSPDSTVSTWQDVRANFPALPIRRYRQLVGHPMYLPFTETLAGKEGAAATFTTSESDSVLIQRIAGDTSGVAILRYSFFDEHRGRLKLIGIARSGEASGENCVQPGVESIRAGRYRPLTRTEFLYVSMARADDPAVRAFVEYYIQNAGQLARQRGYIPFTEEAYRSELERFRNQAASTVLQTTEPGTSTQELPRRGAEGE